jgi:hypothetical protein
LAVGGALQEGGSGDERGSNDDGCSVDGVSAGEGGVSVDGSSVSVDVSSAGGGGGGAAASGRAAVEETGGGELDAELLAYLRRRGVSKATMQARLAQSSTHMRRGLRPQLRFICVYTCSLSASLSPCLSNPFAGLLLLSA